MNLVSKLCNKSHITDVETSQTTSGAELLSKAQKRCEDFKKQGLQAGQRVFIEYGNSTAFFIDLFALWLAESCAVPIDPGNPDIEVQQLINHCKASYRLTEPGTNLIETEFSKLSSPNAHAHLILYTSGTSGTPKGVVHSLESIEQRLICLKQSVATEEFRKSLCILPTHFGHGLIGNSLFPLFIGADLFIGKTFSALNIQSLAQTLNHYEITFVSSVPSIWNLLESAQKTLFKSVVRIHCASADFTENLLAKIKSWSPSADVYNVYGTTETAGWVSGHKITSSQDVGFVGHGWGMQLTVTNLNSEEIGSVHIKGPGLALEYWGLTELSEARLKNSVFNTGDIGEWNSEKGLRLKGRNDDLINKGGLKVNPNEVENVLLTNDSIASVSVFSVEHAITQQTVVAAICFKPNTQMTSAELESWCRAHMPAYRIPSYWMILKELPVTIRGKVDKKSLKELFIQKQALHEI